jgi:methylenetetrahydrofolate dehydrogenase (NADP+) / methenyltetrahydrofolate cyclohydrolase
MQILDGKALSDLIKAQLKEKVTARVAAGKKRPHLAAILVGNDGGSETYVASKIRSCEEIGYASTLIRLENTITEAELLDQIKKINDNPDIDGLIVQLPLPKHMDVEKVIEATDPNKDVDGFHPVNVGRMVQGLPCFLPATPNGIMKILEHYKIDTVGKECVVIGRSDIVGTPMSILMSRNTNPGNATVSLCHSKTKNLKEHCLNADIIIAATGKPGMITADMVKEGAVVIDVGTTRVPDATKKSGFRLSGDVDFANVSPKCSYITPVPGGVGPMTIASLMMNTLIAAEEK